MATRLVECGADPDNRQHGCGGTPLHHTLAGGYLELVKFLLTSKADANASNRYGVHPLHIAVKREFVDCIQYLMTHVLPVQKVKDEVSWAVQYDLTESVHCLLAAGAPYSIRVLTPWSGSTPRAQSSWDYSLPLPYYAVMRGWKVPAMQSVLTNGWSPLQRAVATGALTYTDEGAAALEGVADAVAAGISASAAAGEAGAVAPTLALPVAPTLALPVREVVKAKREELEQVSKPYQASLLHLAVYSGSEVALSTLLGLKRGKGGKKSKELTKDLTVQTKDQAGALLQSAAEVYLRTKREGGEDGTEAKKVAEHL